MSRLSGESVSHWGQDSSVKVALQFSKMRFFDVTKLVTCERAGSRVELEGEAGADGVTTYRVRLCGEFSFAVTPCDEFEKRLVLLWLRLLRTPSREESPWGLVT